MFGSSNSRVFKPVPFGASSRHRKGIPSWVWVLALGITIGAAGLYYIQEQLLPPRLNFIESQDLKAKTEAATKAREQMSAELGQATAQLKVAQDERKTAVDKMNIALTSVEPLKKDLDLFLKAIPPDPRGNAIAIRSGTFSSDSGKLMYHLLFTRDRSAKSNAAFKGDVQIIVEGTRGGKNVSTTVQTLPLTLEGYQHLNGSASLPEGFVPREVTVKLAQEKNGAQVSMRVFRL
jgi:hypothetical protein